jgi:hypothetical protein
LNGLVEASKSVRNVRLRKETFFLLKAVPGDCEPDKIVWYKKIDKTSKLVAALEKSIRFIGQIRSLFPRWC